MARGRRRRRGNKGNRLLLMTKGGMIKTLMHSTSSRSVEGYAVHDICQLLSRCNNAMMHNTLLRHAG